MPGLPPLRRSYACLALGLLVLSAFAPALGFDFVHFDDNHYVTENARVLEGLSRAGLRWAFASDNANYWHPLAFVSHMLDVELFGLDPRGHHLTNLLLHAANALLLFLILEGLTKAPWRAFFVAAAFAAHPLQVETVAWIAERKTLLSVFFLFLSWAAWARHARKPEPALYALSLLGFAGSLSAKPLAVSWPFVLLLLDHWPLARRPRLLAALPFFALSALSCLATLGSAVYVSAIPFSVRAGHALSFILNYLHMITWPTGLGVFYPYPQGTAAPAVLACALFVIAAVSAAALAWRRRAPYLGVGWLWFLGTLVPVGGWVVVGAHGLADRMMYLPIVGILIGAAWGAEPLLRRRAEAAPWLGAAALSALLLASSAQLRHWKDSVALFTRALAVADHPLLRHHLGFSLFRAGRFPEAVAQLRRAAEQRPGDADTRHYLGLALAAGGELDAGVAALREAVRLAPGSKMIADNLAAIDAARRAARR